jgi:septal ring factor EnvC (AmiA/AmiB activator)
MDAPLYAERQNIMAGTPREEATPITWGWLKVAVPLLAVLIGIAIQFSSMQTQVNYQETRLCAQETEMKQLRESLVSHQLQQKEEYAAISTQLVQIQLDLQFLRRDVDRQNAP